MSTVPTSPQDFDGVGDGDGEGGGEEPHPDRRAFTKLLAISLANNAKNPTHGTKPLIKRPTAGSPSVSSSVSPIPSPTPPRRSLDGPSPIVPPRRSLSADRRAPTPPPPRPSSAASLDGSVVGVEDHVHVGSGLARVRSVSAGTGYRGGGTGGGNGGGAVIPVPRERGTVKPKVPPSPLLRFHGDLQRQIDVVAAEIRAVDFGAGTGGVDGVGDAVDEEATASSNARLKALKEAHAAIQMGQGRVIALMDLARRTGLLHLRPATVAHVLAAMEQYVFLQITPEDLVRHRPPRNPCERVVKTTDWFNHVARAVESTILEQPLAAMRARVIHCWADIATELFKLRDMQTLKAVCSAMTTPPIARLRATWSVVPHRSIKALTEYRQLLSEEHNYWAYREWAGRNSVRPAVPFLGVYIQDVYYLVAVIKKEYGSDDPDLMLQDKRVREVVERIAWYQQGPLYSHVMGEGKGPTVHAYEMMFERLDKEGKAPSRKNAGDTELSKKVAVAVAAVAAAAPAAGVSGVSGGGGGIGGDRTSMYQMLMQGGDRDRADAGGARDVLQALLRALPGSTRKGGSGGVMSGTVEDGLKDMDMDQTTVFVAHWFLTRDWYTETEVDELSAQREPKIAGEDDDGGYSSRPLSGLEEYSERGERRSWILKKMMRDVATKSWSGDGDDEEDGALDAGRTGHSMVDGLVDAPIDGKKSKRRSKVLGGGKEERRSLGLFGIGNRTSTTASSSTGSGHLGDQRISSASDGSTTLVESTRDSGASGHSSVSTSSGVSPASSRPPSTLSTPRLSTASSSDDVQDKFSGKKGKVGTDGDGIGLAASSKPGTSKPFAYLSADQLGTRKLGLEHRRAATVGESPALDDVHGSAGHKAYKMSGVRFADGTDGLAGRDARESRESADTASPLSPTRSSSADSGHRSGAVTPPLPARAPPMPARPVTSSKPDTPPRSSMSSSVSLGSLASVAGRSRSPPPDLPSRRNSVASPPAPRLPPRPSSPGGHQDQVAIPSEPPSQRSVPVIKARGPISGDPNAALAQILAQKQNAVDSADDLALRRKSTLKRVG
ncbi:RasGEF [Gonapodya sp. JEL0774]|nr:RasGEF [Gonapodya sp. JEL0774]